MPDSDSSSNFFLKAATPELYRQNAFRLTGLPVTATSREVARQAEKLKMMAELGGQAAQQLAVIPGMEPPTLEEIREATQRLKEVEARAFDEFFWFWPEDWEKPDEDEAFAALKRHDLDTAFSIWANREVQTESLRDYYIASHNIALVLHMRAIEWSLVDFTHSLPPERISKVYEYWNEAFDRWEWLADDDRLWEAFKTRIRQINDPALTTGFARRLRRELPQVFDKINAELALTYAQHSRSAEAQWHVDFLKSTHSGQDDVGLILDIVLAPTRTRLERAIESAQNSTKADKQNGITHATQLLGSAEPLLTIFGMLQATDNPERRQLFDQVARTVLNCAADGYNASNQAFQNQPPPLAYAMDPRVRVNETFLQALGRAEALASDAELLNQIRQNIQTVAGNHKFDTLVKPILDELAAIQKQNQHPSEKISWIKAKVIPRVDDLFQRGVLDASSRQTLTNSLAVVLRDIALTANNAFYVPKLGMEALTLAARYARDPELLARLKADSLTMSQNMISAPKPSSNAGGVFVLVVVAMLILLGISKSGSSKSQTNYTYPSTQTAKPAQPNYNYPIPKLPTYQPPVSTFVPPISTTSSSQIPGLSIKDWHIWKNRSMKEITAKMLSFDGVNVVLQTQDEKTYRYAFSDLSPESQLLARKLSLLPKEPVKLVPQALPRTGLFSRANKRLDDYGPLTIDTRAGSGHFYVKLVDKKTMKTSLVIFIRDGETATDISVPAGTYELRYASGDTWYGEENLFGEYTSYSKAGSTFSFQNGDGYTVELFKQIGGNLSTNPMSKDSF